MNSPYYRERTAGSKPRTVEQLDREVSRSILKLIETRCFTGWFGVEFPTYCTDGKGIFGGDWHAMRARATAVITDFASLESSSPETLVMLDFLEFCHEYVARPSPLDFHSYWNHHHLAFDSSAGQSLFRDEINGIFRTHGMVFELTSAGRVDRIGDVVQQTVLAARLVKTADAKLEEMWNDAVTKFMSPRPEMRKDGLDKLWDVWERLKTLELPNQDKKQSAEALLKRVANGSDPLFDVLNKEAAELTRIGNEFHIRHAEVKKHPVDSPQMVDYLFHRMSAMIWRLTR